MIIYLVKGIACSLVLWAFHHFFLEKERMHKFNRLYLLAAPVISLLLPFIPLRRADVSGGQFQTEGVAGVSSEAPLFRVVQATAEAADFSAGTELWQWLTGAYLFMALFLLFRLLNGVFRMNRLINASGQHKLPEATMVLLPGQSEICTFMHYVLCSEKDYHKNLIPAPILLHEFAHVKQKHTWDILFMELTGALYWFNPVILLYKKAIRLNHEFLADQYVTDRQGKVSDYQQLLLDWLAGDPAPQFASGFNYSQTKKRLIMMTQTTHLERIVIKGAFLSILSAGMFYAASDEIKAQAAPPPPPVELTPVQTTPPPPPFEITELPVIPPPPPPSERWSPGPGLTDEELADYNASFEKHKVTKVNEKGVGYSAFAFQDQEKERLWQMVKKMSREQLRQAGYTILKVDVPRKNPPSEELFESFKRRDVYGVWLNNKKIDSSVLDGYKHSDIADYSISKLYGAAKKGRSYTHQINIETNAYFDANFKKRMADRYIVSERVKKDR